MDAGTCRTLAVGLCLTCLFGAATAAGDNPPSTNAQHWDLRDTLLQRMEREQAPRRELMQRMQAERVGDPQELDPLRDDLLRSIRAEDSANRGWLKKVIAEHGWPGRSLVGVDGAHAAWLLVQHADADRPFQKECLQLMEAAPAGEVAGDDIAYLTDRVRLADGRPQLYGTQLEFRDGEWVPRPIEDEAHVDQRRKERGLPSLADYLKFVGAVLTAPGK